MHCQEGLLFIRDMLCACGRVAWDDPYGGNGSDTFVLSPDGAVLTQHTDMRMKDGGKRCTYKYACQCFVVDPHRHSNVNSVLNW